MKRAPSIPSPWNKGDRVTAKHLDEDRRAIKSLVERVGPRQLDAPQQDNEEVSDIGDSFSLSDAIFITKETREESLEILDSSQAVVGEAVLEITTRIKVTLGGSAIWIPME